MLVGCDRSKCLRRYGVVFQWTASPTCQSGKARLPPERNGPVYVMHPERRRQRRRFCWDVFVASSGSGRAGSAAPSGVTKDEAAPGPLRGQRGVVAQPPISLPWAVVAMELAGIWARDGGTSVLLTQQDDTMLSAPERFCRLGIKRQSLPKRRSERAVPGARLPRLGVGGCSLVSLNGLSRPLRTALSARPTDIAVTRRASTASRRLTTTPALARAPAAGPPPVRPRMA